MDQKDLIEEIVARVAAKMAELEHDPVTDQAEVSAPDTRPGLLILTQDHSDVCHSVFDSGCLAKRYKIGCALLQNYEVNIDDYQAVILFGLTNEALGKLASGIYDTPYTKLAGQAFLSGKQIYVPVEQIELYRYEKTAPKPYFAMLRDRLELLKASGLVISRMDDLEKCILDESCGCAIQAVSQPDPTPTAQKTYRLCKRVITERDIAEASTAKACCVYIPAKSIVTDLAKDYARSRDISLIRE